MTKNERNRRIDAINTQIKFCGSLLTRLDRDFNVTMRAQDKEEGDSAYMIRHHTRYAQDARRIRLEMLALIKLLEEP